MQAPGEFSLKGQQQELGLQIPRGEACSQNCHENSGSQVLISLPVKRYLEQSSGPRGRCSPSPPPWPHIFGPGRTCALGHGAWGGSGGRACSPLLAI